MSKVLVKFGTGLKAMLPDAISLHVCYLKRYRWEIMSMTRSLLCGHFSSHFFHFSPFRSMLHKESMRQLTGRHEARSRKMFCDWLIMTMTKE
jgi:hypothetical protein